MFDWRKRVQILRAENALRDGRLDEAFLIASEDGLKSWRGCQVVLEKLVDPLLDRAAVHLAQGSLKDALADLDRAQAAGGNRPRLTELRARVVARREELRRVEARERDLLVSARRHLAQGSLGAGKALLDEVTTMDPEAVRLRREADNREGRAREACARAELLLGEGAVLEALKAGRDALQAHARHEGLPALLLRLKAAGIEAVDQALLDGSLAAAKELHSQLVLVCGESVEARRSGEALDLCREAAARISAGDHEGAQAAVSRLKTLLPSNPWVEACDRAVAGVAESLRSLRAGPLGRLQVRASPTSRPAPGASRVESARSGRHLLWVDGVGSYLVLTGDRLTLGRAGSSAHPDVALAADIGGVQAEVLRVDDDYFLAAHGAVEVNGRRAERKLLADGDRVTLAPRCELEFRLPTPLSTSAVLVLSGGQRIAGDAREIILLDRHLILGPGEGCHIRASGASRRIFLCAGASGFILRAEEGIIIDGKPEGNEAPVKPGAQIQVGEVTFTVTPLAVERS